MRIHHKSGSNNLNLFHNHYTHKAVLSCDPESNPDDYIVMVIYCTYCRLAFIRPATDTTWTYIDRNIYKKPMSDVIYYKGKILAVDWFGMVVCCEEDIDNKWTVRMVTDVLTIFSPYHKKYLVESLDGELLQVHRSYDYDESEPQKSYARATAREFKVFKLVKDIDDDSDSNCGDQWMEMKSIGDCALFLGDNESTSLRASDIPGCSSNSIYFTADGIDGTYPPSAFGYTDKGVFHFENGTIERFDYNNTPVMGNQPPIWITTVKNDEVI